MDEKILNVQKEAYKTWLKTDKKGTLEVHTGMGKTFIALQAISDAPKGSSVLFLAEVRDREETLYKEIEKFNSIYNTDLKSDYKITFACYQSAYKWNGLTNNIAPLYSNI